MAVLYRTNAQSRAVEEAFRRASLPYRIVGAVSFYQRREVKDLIAYLRLVVNPSDNEAFLRAVNVPKRGIGQSSVAWLQESAAKWSKSLLSAAAIADRISELRPHAKAVLTDFASMLENLRANLTTMAPVTVLESIIEATEYETYLTQEGIKGIERLENVRELVAGAAEWSEELDPDEPGSPLEAFLANAALISPSDNLGGDPEGVNLMTVHSAKGLEWPIVVVSGLEDGLFPLSRALDTEQGAEEERRLAYVAVTRARDRAYLSWARTRRRSGQLIPGARSRFLESIPPGVVEERRSSGFFGGDMYQRSSKPRTWLAFEESAPEELSQDSPRYVKGERVLHRRFGSGTIKELSGRGRDLKVVVCFDDDEIGTKKLLVAYAGLERDWETA
jgi:DNA helicase-2/ATP-dependent DNA helicase PcrA